jgi:hypothetical protein
MQYGLSDRDRERLERARQQAEVKMAAERRRIERARGREERARPSQVVIPEGKTIELQVLRSTAIIPPYTADLGADELILLALAVSVAAMAASLVVRLAFIGRGWTVYVTVPERKAIRMRLRTEEAAAQRMREVAEALERDGLAALDLWMRRGRRCREEWELGEAPAG